MMKFFGMAKAWLFFTLVTAFFVAGCGLVEPAENANYVTEEGVAVEALFPADSLMVFKVGTSDTTQWANLNKINEAFPADLLATFRSRIDAELKRDNPFEDLGLDYDDEVAPIIGENAQVFIALNMENFLDDPDLVIAVKVSDADAMKKLLDKAIEEEKPESEDYKGITLYTAKAMETATGGGFLYKDVLVFSNKVELLKAGVDNLMSGVIPIMSENAKYSDVVKDVDPNLAMLYFDLEDFMKIALDQADGPDAEAFAQLESIFGGQNVFEAVKTELIVLKAEPRGLMIEVDVKGDVGEVFMPEKVMTAYLFDQIPANEPMLYLESYTSAADSMKALDIFKADPQLAEGFAMIEAGLAEQDLNLETDIVPVFDSGIALLLDNLGSPIPGFGAYVDVEGAQQPALKLATKLNDLMDEAYRQAIAETPEIAAFVSKDVLEEGKLWKYEVDIDAALLDAPDEVAQVLSGQNIELTYGVKDNLFFIALTPDFLNALNGPFVSDSQEFKVAREVVEGYDYGFGYFSFSTMLDFAETWVQIARDSGQGDVALGYGMVQSYLKPIKGISFASSKPSSEGASSALFIRIED